MHQANTVTSLPRRRGVVMRAQGITDSYGTAYERDVRSGGLRRVGPKKRSTVVPQGWGEIEGGFEL